MYETSVLETDRTEDQPVSAKTRAKSRSSGKSRRMQLLERMRIFSYETNGIGIQRATSFEDLYNAYKLVHDLFVEEGYIRPDPCGLRIRMFEAMPHTATFIAKDGDKIVGVTSVAIDSPDIGLPSDQAFKKEIDQLRLAGRKPCEGTNWAVTLEYRRSAIMIELMRCSFAYALLSGCTDMLADVSPGHHPFYEILCFETIGSERSSSPEIYDPVVLERNAFDKFLQRLTKVQLGEVSDDAVVNDFFVVNNPYFERVRQWAMSAHIEFLNPELLRQLFIEHSDFLYERYPEELSIIRKHWGNDVFTKVWENQDIYNDRYIAISA